MAEPLLVDATPGAVAPAGDPGRRRRDRPGFYHRSERRARPDRSTGRRMAGRGRRTRVSLLVAPVSPVGVTSRLDSPRRGRQVADHETAPRMTIRRRLIAGPLVQVPAAP